MCPYAALIASKRTCVYSTDQPVYAAKTIKEEEEKEEHPATWRKRRIGFTIRGTHVRRIRLLAAACQSSTIPARRPGHRGSHRGQGGALRPGLGRRFGK